MKRLSLCLRSILILSIASAGGIARVSSPPGGALSATTVTFGNQTAGTISANQSVTVTNSGLGPLSISAIYLKGANASQFVLATTSTSCWYNGATLAPGATCTIDVAFSPQTTGEFAAIVSLEEPAGSPSPTISVSGTATAAPMSYSISGQVTLGSGLGGVPLPGVTVTLSTGASTTTDASGNYSFSGLAALVTLTVSPTAAGYYFEPPSQTMVIPNSHPIFNFAAQSGSGALQFIPVPPCRVVDTRNPAGTFGGPFIAADSFRNFIIPNSACGVPATARAYSLNVTVIPSGPLGYLAVWPAQQSGGSVGSLLNSQDGRVKADAVIVGAGDPPPVGGAIILFATNDTHAVVDINGYFVPAASGTGLAFYPLPPCRVADTRNTTPMSGGKARTFSILSSSCNVPSSAQAYALNFTAVPHTTLGYLTTWPTGQPQPFVSTLNSPTGAITANAAIVPAGANGAIDAFVSNDSDLVIDIDGYFAPPGSGGLSLYPLGSCRLLDTRYSPNSVPPPFSGTMVMNAAAGGCAVPSTAQAYVLNATVIPSGALGYLTVWPQGQTPPLASTLNSLDGAIVSNMAIVPTTNGLINVFASNPTQLILDIAGYFAP